MIQYVLSQTLALKIDDINITIELAYFTTMMMMMSPPYDIEESITSKEVITTTTAVSPNLEIPMNKPMREVNQYLTKKLSIQEQEDLTAYCAALLHITSKIVYIDREVKRYGFLSTEEVVTVSSSS